MIITLLIRSINFFKSIIRFSEKRKSGENKNNNSKPSSDNFSHNDIQDADFEEMD